MNEQSEKPISLSADAFRKAFANPSLGAWDYLAYRADLDLAQAVADFLFPEFIEVEGFVLLAEMFRKNKEEFAVWRKKYHDDTRKVEETINHVHMYDLFRSSGENDLAAYERVGRLVAKCWTLALKDAFPEREFTVQFATEPKDYGPTITFFQKNRG